MAEFERNDTGADYSQSVETFPLIIRYKAANVDWSNKHLTDTTVEKLIERFSGRHEFFFVNKGQDRLGHPLIQIMMADSDFHIKVSPAKEGRNFFNPNFEEEKFVLPVDEKEYLTKVCNLIFVKEDDDLVEVWQKIGWLDRLSELKDFIGECCRLQRPLKEIRMEEDRQIWQAYIDGLNALNDAKKELFKIKSIGKPRNERDHHGNKIKTITIELDNESQSQTFKEEIQALFDNQFEELPKIIASKKMVTVEYDTYRVISDDLLSDLEDLAKDHCYKLSENQPVYSLSGSISLKVKRSDFEEAKKAIDKDLESFGAKFQIKEGEYIFSNDEDVDFFQKIVTQKYGEYISAERSSSLVGKFVPNGLQSSFDVIAQSVNKIEGVKKVTSQQGFLIVESSAPLDLDNLAFSKLSFSSCRVKLTPQKFDNNVSVLPVLTAKNGAYFATITDVRKVSINPNGWKFSIINSYKKAGLKTWVFVSYFYAFRIGVDKSLIRPLQLSFLSNEKININSVRAEVEVLPDNSADYLELQDEISRALPEGLTVSYPEYSVSCRLVFLADNETKCKQTFNNISNALSEIKFNHYGFAKDSRTEVNFSIVYTTEEERDHHINCISKVISDFNKVAEVNFASPQGTTTISLSLDEGLLDEHNKRLNSDFFNENVNYVSLQYDAIRESLEEARQDNDDEEDDEFADRKFESQVRIRQAIFKREAPTMGVCINRTPSSVKVKLSEEFIEQIQDGEVKLSGGYLQFPVIGSSMELSRQKLAMDKITHPGEIRRRNHPVGYPANPNLPNFLFDPRYADDIEDNIEDEKARIASSVIEHGLNEKQLEAVTKAVLAKDMAFIQGPPGTGKTTVIAEIIWQEVLRKPDSRILLTSQTNLAVDNALERLQGKRGIRPVRIFPRGKIEKFEQLEREGKRYLLPMIEKWKDNAAAETSDNAVNNWIDMIHDGISNNSRYAEVLSQWKDDLEKKDDYIRQTFVQSYKSKVNLVAATCSICGSKDFLTTYQSLYGSQEEPYFDVVIMDEASKATPLEMAVPMVLGKTIIVIGDHKQLPPMMDENSIDTALKKIGRGELAEKLENIKESQFKRLFEAAQKIRPNLVATLDTQYRMHEQIMQTINHFYKDDLVGGLRCGIKDTMNDPDLSDKGSRYHGLNFKNILRPDIHAIWVNVHAPEKKDGSSYANPEELKAIEMVLKAIEQSDGYAEYMTAMKKPEDKEIGLITFYSAQKRAIKDMQRKGRLGHNAFRIDVVDKFQGMERNIVVVSTVRSNNKNRMGFADRIERINVAFSRAKRLLIVVGDKQFFERNENYRKSISSMEVVDVKQLRDALK